MGRDSELTREETTTPLAMPSSSSSSPSSSSSYSSPTSSRRQQLSRSTKSRTWCSPPVAMVMALTLALTLTSSSSGLVSATASTQASNNCQLIPVRTNIIKETTVLYLDRQVQASCSGEVQLHKCEGQCESKVIPSVRHARGFRMDCRCCKEDAIVTRTVLLNRCFHNGELLPGTQFLVEVNDLQRCRCLACTN